MTAALTALAALSACSSDSGGSAPPRPGTVAVVASTNVWGDIAAQIGGAHVTVTSLIHDPSQDPHAFEPTGRDELAVSRARVVIVNGGGYDDVVDQMLDSVGSRPIVVDAVTAASAVGSIDADNEHVWFDLHAAVAVGRAIAAALGKALPASSSEFDAAATRFAASLEPAREILDRLRRHDPGAPIAVTEALPLYLTAAAGLKNVMPAAFTDAVEEGIDVAPSEMADVLALFTERRVKLVIYNEQASGSQTGQVLAAAKQNRIPVLPVTEILPAGEHYQGWITSIASTMSDLMGVPVTQ